MKQLESMDYFEASKVISEMYLYEYMILYIIRCFHLRNVVYFFWELSYNIRLGDGRA